jgi:protein required for attachment to host cells
MAKGELCIVIADGGHARFVRPAADNALHTIEAIDSVDLHKKDQDLVSDKPGRAYESATPARHAYTPRSDPHDMAKDRFARMVAERVNESYSTGTFGELVVVAPSSVLGELTGGLNAATRGRLIGTLARDLVNTPDHELRPHLAEWVRPVQRA